MNRFFLAAAISLLACGGKSAAEGPPGQKGGRRVEFPVEVQPVAAERVEVRIEAVGSIEAFEEVQVTARVPGAIERAHFAEGDRVKNGQLLLEIEPRRYQLHVAAAGAKHAQAEAQLAEAEAAMKRRTEVNEKRPGLVMAEELEVAGTRVAIARAALAETQAALHLAELNLRDAVVKAPMDGIIERRVARTGQYVQPGALLATLVRREPLLLRFKVPEQEASRIDVGQVVSFSVGAKEGPLGAKVIQVSQAAEEASRMVTITARVEDPLQASLRAGSFAQVVVGIGGSGRESPVIPQTAVRPSEKGFLTFVVEDNVAKERVITLGLRTSKGLVEVRSGLQIGETVVIRGAEALREGAKVIVKKVDGS